MWLFGNIEKKGPATVRMYVPYKSEYYLGFQGQSKLGWYEDIQEAIAAFPTADGILQQDLVKIGDNLYVRPGDIITGGKKNV